MPETPDGGWRLDEAPKPTYGAGDYDRPLAQGRRAFYDRVHDVICSSEGYLLVVGSTVDGYRRWIPAVPVAFLSRRGAICKVVAEWPDASAAEELADAIGEVLPPPVSR